MREEIKIENIDGVYLAQANVNGELKIGQGKTESESLHSLARLMMPPKIDELREKVNEIAAPIRRSGVSIRLDENFAASADITMYIYIKYGEQTAGMRVDYLIGETRALVVSEEVQKVMDRIEIFERQSGLSR